MNQVNKHVLIIENSLSGLKLNESATKLNAQGQPQYLLGGIFTEFDVMNRNDRIYTADKFVPHLNELIERKNTLGVIFGEFDHPDVFDTSLSRASHIIENVWYNKEANRIDGQIRLLNTRWGKEAQAIINDGLPIFVSSRAAGVTESNGHVSVKKLFTYDAVADPGFGTAKMTSINESLGLSTNNSNYRIYELTNESKFNELIMENNNNEYVTGKQLDEYSEYLNGEMNKISIQINESVKNGKVSPEQIRTLAETQELLQEQQQKVTQYLNYLTEQIQFVVNENITLKETTEKLITHSDHLTENLNKNINYSEYLAEELDKNINYSEYIAETLDKNIDFSEYIAEHVDSNIKYSDYLAESIEKSNDYSEYIAENLDKNIAYSEYIAENLDNNIAYSEYLAENLDNNIAYSEYLAENLDKTIDYSEYIAEHVDNNIAYSEYIAEHVDNNIAYSEYIAENVSDSKAYMNYIAESLDNTVDAINNNMLTEGAGGPVSVPNMTQIDDYTKYYDEDDDFVKPNVQAQAQVNGSDVQALVDGVDAPVQVAGEVQTQVQAPVDGVQDAPVDDVQDTQVQAPVDGVQDAPVDGVVGEPVDGVQSVDDVQLVGLEDAPIDNNIQAQLPNAEMPNSVEGDDLNPTKYANNSVVSFGDDGTMGEIVASNPETGFYTIKVNTGDMEEVHESKINFTGDDSLENTKQLTTQIEKLILETKKRKASEVKDPHFVQFLTENKKKAWHDLAEEDKEKVIFAINESKTPIYSEAQLLVAINETLTPSISFEEELISNIPSSLIPAWEKIDEKMKVSILSQAKLYPSMNNSLKMEKFWESRNLVNYTMINETKTILNDNVIDNSSLTDEEIDSFIAKFKNLER